jgi:hypothetical protein
MSDFFMDVANKQVANIDAEVARVDAELMKCRVNNDPYEALDLIQQRANLRDSRRALLQEQSDYVAQFNRRAPELTDSEFLALSPERMLQHPEAVEKIFQKSKYYDRADGYDPNSEFSKRFSAGIEEVKRRRARGQ